PFFSSVFLYLFFFFYSYADHRALHSFPTRRSSDLPSGVTSRLPPRLSSSPTAVGFCCSKAPTNWIGLGNPPAMMASTGGRLVSRSEEHTSELQSRGHLVCRLLLEKKKKKNQN